MARKKKSVSADSAVNYVENRLEIAIGHEIRTFRKMMGLTVAELSNLSGISVGMMSKIENGNASPSLGTIQALSKALNVPVTAFFRRFEEERSATYVRAGEGLSIERRGTRAGHQYQLLGHSVGKSIAFEPYMITLTDESDVFPIFQHPGMEFLYILTGEVLYRHGNKTYNLTVGDSLFFDSDAPHGPEKLIKLPAKFIAAMVYHRFANE